MPTIAATTGPDVRRRASSASAARSTKRTSRSTRFASCRAGSVCRRGTNRHRRACRRAFRITPKSPMRNCERSNAPSRRSARSDSASAASAITTISRESNSAATRSRASSSPNVGGDRPGAESRRLPLRHDRSARLSLGQSQRRASADRPRDPFLLADRRTPRRTVSRASPAVSSAVARRSRFDQFRARRSRLRRVAPSAAPAWISVVHPRGQDASRDRIVGGPCAQSAERPRRSARRVRLLALFRALDRDRPDSCSRGWPSLLVATCPLYWLTAARPLSDAAGLAAALAVQALIADRVVVASADRVAAGCAGFAPGIRSQIVWLTLPLLVLAIVAASTRRQMGGLVRVTAAYVVGALVWAIPLVDRLGRTVSIPEQRSCNQGAEDLTGVAMLATTHTVSLADPHAAGPADLAVGLLADGDAVVVLAVLGFVQMSWRDRPALLTLIACFGPYMVFDLLFQEAITTRYALPLVIPIAFLAIRGASLLHRNLAVAATIAHRVRRPVFVDDATALRIRADACAGVSHARRHARRPLGARRPSAGAGDAPEPDEFDMRRPIQWVGDEMPTLAAHLPAPAQARMARAGEVLERRWPRAGLVRRRSAAKRPRAHPQPTPAGALSMAVPFHDAGRRRQARTRWTGTSIDAPDWYLGEGWALTPETAGVAGEDHRGPGLRADSRLDSSIARAADADDRRTQSRTERTARPRPRRASTEQRCRGRSWSPPGFSCR